MTTPYDTEQPAKMYIKIVPNDDPNHNGKWITVNRREEKFRSFADTVDVYAPDIPEGHRAVSFARWPDQRWGGTIEGE